MFRNLVIRNLRLNRFFLLFILIASLSFVNGGKKITLWMIGDSTMANKAVNKYPETGWGMAFGSYFDSSVRIENHAQNGRSTLSFINEKRWDTVLSGLKKGDYVFIEFGHNDEKVEKPGVGTSHVDFAQNLSRFVQETRAKKAYPILMTPIVRRSFEGETLLDTHKGYPEVVRRLADSLKVPLIDMEQKTRKLVTTLGPEKSISLFLHLAPGHKNYPKGVVDNTHLNTEGADQFARLAAQGVKELKLDLQKKLLHYRLAEEGKSP